MIKRNEISAEQRKELEETRRENKNKNVDRRLKALILHAQGESREEVSKQTEYAKSYITELVAKYCNHGLEAIVGNHYKGNHRNMSFAEEEALLEPFKKLAAEGKIVETSAILKAYEAKLGRTFEKDNGRIYRVLERHSWRKVMPRSKHPNKASDEEIESSKKLTLRSKKHFAN